MQALTGISENARKHIERSRTDRARTYDTLLQQYRRVTALPIDARTPEMTLPDVGSHQCATCGRDAMVQTRPLPLTPVLCSQLCLLWHHHLTFDVPPVQREAALA